MDVLFGLKVGQLPAYVAPNKLGFSKSKAAEREVGAEFEIEGSNLPGHDTLRYYWNVTGDGSLRGPSAEYVLKQPLSFEQFKERAFPYLTKNIRKCKAKTKMSGRCSTHIHINVHDLYLYQVWAFVALYYCYEDVAMQIAGQERAGNLFCVGASNSSFIEKVMVDKTVIANTTMNTKYAAVNMSSVGKFGSLEFRALRGTISHEVVYAWIDFLLKIKEYVKGLSPEQVAAIPDRISMNTPRGFLDNMLGKGEASDYLREHLAIDFDISTLTYEGTRRIQRVFYEIPWHVLVVKEDGMSDKDWMTQIIEGYKSDSYSSEDLNAFTKYSKSGKYESFMSVWPKDLKIPFDTKTVFAKYAMDRVIDHETGLTRTRPSRRETPVGTRTVQWIVDEGTSTATITIE